MYRCDCCGEDINRKLSPPPSHWENAIAFAKRAWVEAQTKSDGQPILKKPDSIDLCRSCESEIFDAEYRLRHDIAGAMLELQISWASKLVAEVREVRKKAIAAQAKGAKE